MKEKFIVVWQRHAGTPCPYRTVDTGLTLADLLKKLFPVLEENGVSVEVQVEDVPGKGDLFFNDIPLDTLLSKVAEAERYCSGPSRMEELGNPACVFDPDAPVGQVLPEILFRKAVLLALED